VGQARFLRLRYTLPPLADLNSVLDYIAAHSPQSAQPAQARIQAIIDLLLLYPSIRARGRSNHAAHAGVALPLS
jgi:hypothetical protein